MNTIPKIIYSIREGIKEYKDDSEFDDRYLLFKANTFRSVLLRQELNNLQKQVSSTITQSLCLELEEVSAYECGLDFGCETIMRTIKPVPTLIDLAFKPAIYNVKPTKILGKSFSFITREQAVHYEHSPFKNSIFAFLHTDNHVYVVSRNDGHKLIDCLNIVGVFFNPLDLENYTNCCGCDIKTKPCFNEETTAYPIGTHHVGVLIAEVVKDIISKELRISEDRINDATDQQQTTES